MASAGVALRADGSNLKFLGCVLLEPAVTAKCRGRGRLPSTKMPGEELHGTGAPWTTKGR